MHPTRKRDNRTIPMNASQQEGNKRERLREDRKIRFHLAPDSGARSICQMNQADVLAVKRVRDDGRGEQEGR